VKDNIISKYIYKRGFQYPTGVEELKKFGRKRRA
jgi:hypothetical protein